MKKFLMILAAVSALSVSSCQWKEYEEPQDVSDATAGLVEIVGSEDIVFSPAGGSSTVTLSSGKGVSVSTNRVWCSASVSGDTITVTTESNPSSESRYARVTVSRGAESFYFTIHQFGEIFSGLEMKDFSAPYEGTVVTLSFLSNMDVVLSSNQDWVSFVKNDEEGTVDIVVAENHDPATRFASISFASGTKSGSAVVTQAPPVSKFDGWSFALTGGMFDFPDQIDQITVTPDADVVKYVSTVVGKNDVGGDIDAYIRDTYLPGVLSDLKPASADDVLSGVFTGEYRNLSASVYAIAARFDADGYTTGQYGYQEISIPDRGPVKTLVDGWDVALVSSSYVYPDQVNEFTVTPKSGYETSKYIVTVVPKASVSTSVEDYAFSYAMSIREEILLGVESGKYLTFDEGLRQGSGSYVSTNVKGDVYAIVVEFSDNKFYTGNYSCAELTVDDEVRKYWIGEWTMTNTAGQTYAVTIKERATPVADTLSMYCKGLYTGTGSTLVKLSWVDLVYNDDGTVSLYSQNHPELTTTYNATYGDLTPYLCPFYDRNGTTYYSRAAGNLIMTLGLTDTGAGLLKVGTVESGGETCQIHSLKMYYYSSVRANVMAFTSNLTITLDGFAMTKK